MRFTPLRLFAVFVVLVSALIVMNRGSVALGIIAQSTPKMSLDERAELIGSGIEIHTPNLAESPLPVVLLMHGCAGPRQEFQRQWADIVTSAGYAAVIVDSTGPRGYSREKALEIVCAGKALFGQERAGDIPAVLSLLADDKRLDLSHLILAGWSHGAWSIMDYLTMDPANPRPSGLHRFNQRSPDVDGAILFYPYCGFGTRSRFKKWRQTPPTLALIAEADTIVDASECITYFEKRRKKGADIEVKVYPGAEHVFDDPFLEPDYKHWYNDDYFKDAKERFVGFLNAQSASAAK